MRTIRAREVVRRPMVNQVRGNKIHPAPKHASANKVHPAPKHADHSATARRPTNAWKHGGHSNLGVLPGEDPEEFDRHHQSLIGEFKPSGPTECDIVLSLAKCMWRKSRLGFYAQAAAARLKWSEV